MGLPVAPRRKILGVGGQGLRMPARRSLDQNLRNLARCQGFASASSRRRTGPGVTSAGMRAVQNGGKAPEPAGLPKGSWWINGRAQVVQYGKNGQGCIRIAKTPIVCQTSGAQLTHYGRNGPGNVRTAKIPIVCQV